MALYVTGEKLFRSESKAAVAVARKVFRAANLGKVDVSLVFVLDAEMKALNKRWRKKNRPTDVLSFPAWEGVDDSFFVVDERLLGDLVISIETAARQASEHGHGLLTEIGVLVCHGLLHLAGLDHERGVREAAQQLMVEMNILDNAGLPVDAALGGRDGQLG